VAGRLERHRVADDPEALALARGGGVSGGVGRGKDAGHGAMVPPIVDQRHFMSFWLQ
jgi:hypothetical protein